MIVPTIILGVVAIICLVVSYQKGLHFEGIKKAVGMTIKMMPLLLIGFLVAGLIQVLMPKELLIKWLGSGSDFKGAVIKWDDGAEISLVEYGKIIRK